MLQSEPIHIPASGSLASALTVRLRAASPAQSASRSPLRRFEHIVAPAVHAGPSAMAGSLQKLRQFAQDSVRCVQSP